MTCNNNNNTDSRIKRYSMNAITTMFNYTPLVGSYIKQNNNNNNNRKNQVCNNNNMNNNNNSRCHSRRPSISVSQCISNEWHERMSLLLDESDLSPQFLFSSFAHVCYTAIDQSSHISSNNIYSNNNTQQQHQQYYLDCVQCLLGSAWCSALLPPTLAFYLVLSEGNIKTNNNDNNTTDHQQCDYLISHVMLTQLYNQYHQVILQSLNNQSIQPSHAIYNTALEAYIQICSNNSQDSNTINQLDDSLEFDLFLAGFKQQIGELWRDNMLALINEFYTSMKQYESIQTNNYDDYNNDYNNINTQLQQSTSYQHATNHQQWLTPISYYTQNSKLQLWSNYDWFDRCTDVLNSVNTLCSHLLSYAVTTSIGKLISDIIRLMLQTSQLLLGGDMYYKTTAQHEKEYTLLVEKFQNVLHCLRDVFRAIVIPQPLLMPNLNNNININYNNTIVTTTQQPTHIHTESLLLQAQLTAHV